MPWQLAIDERYIYWTTRTALRRAPLAGGAATTLAIGNFAHIAAADGGVYATDTRAGEVYRFDRETGSALVLGTGEYPDGIAVRGQNVYWTNGASVVGSGTVAQASVDGESHRILATGLAQPSGIAADDSFVYFTSTARSCGVGECVGGGVAKLSLEDQSVQIIDPAGTPRDVVLGKRGAYWISTPTKVMFAGFSADAAVKLADALGEPPGPIAVDDEAFYWSSTDRGRVLKVGLEGGALEPIVTDLGYIGGIAVDRSWVYVAALQQGRILRAAKDGRAAKPSAPVTGPCPMPLGTAADIAATPRAEPNLELLALRIDAGRVTASDETYARVTADVAAIREAEPDLADIGYFANSDGKSLVLSPNELTMQSIRQGDYAAWDCLNEFYGLEDVQIGSSFVVLELKGMYELGLLAELYQQLPGIPSAQSNLSGGDTSTICARREGSTFEYAVDRRGGDCPAGCNIHEAHHFVSTAPGVIDRGGVWKSEASADSPEWFKRLCRR